MAGSVASDKTQCTTQQETSCGRIHLVPEGKLRRSGSRWLRLSADIEAGFPRSSSALIARFVEILFEFADQGGFDA